MEPVVTVEIEFTPGVWTDVSAYLRAGEVKRGKAKATTKSSPGQAIFTMSNEGRMFDPEYSGNISPGNLGVNIGIRAEATYNSLPYWLFTGQIDRIIQRYLGPNNAIATLTCIDGLAALARDGLGSAYEVEAKRTFPRAWFRFAEQAGPTANNRIGGRYGAYVGAPGFGEPGDFGDDAAVKFGTPNDYVLFPPGIMPETVNWTIALVVTTPVWPVGSEILVLLFDTEYPYGLTVWVDSAGMVNARHTLRNGTFAYAKTFITIGTGPVSVEIRSTTVGPPYLKILYGGFDVTDAGSATGAGSNIIDPSYYVMGATSRVLIVDELLTWDRAVSDSELLDLDYGASGWLLDNVKDRINRVLDAAGWDAAAREVSLNGDYSLRGTSLGGSALEHVEAIAATAEARAPFVKRDGTFKQFDRDDHLEAPYTVAQATLGDGPGEIPYVGLGDYALDLDTVENVVHRRWWTVFKEAAFLIEASNVPAGQSRRAGAEIESLYSSPDSEYSLAMFRIAKRGTPTPYIEGLKVLPRDDPDVMFPVVLGLELGDRIAWKRRPQGIGPAIERDAIVEGVNHSLGPLKWETTFLVDSSDATKFFLFDITEWDSPDWRFKV